MEVANIDGMEHVAKKQNIFISDKGKDVASWVKNSITNAYINS